MVVVECLALGGGKGRRSPRRAWSLAPGQDDRILSEKHHHGNVCTCMYKSTLPATWAGAWSYTLATYPF